MRRTRSVLLVAFVTILGVLAVPTRAANDPHYGKQWNMRIIGAETAWATGTGKGVTIAVVDTGVFFGHEDFASGKLLAGRNFVASGNPPADDEGHGTHVAGIAAASTNNGKGVVGVAPDARILPVKVLDADGGGTYSAAASGIRWAADNGAQVVNLSLGSTVSTLIGSPTVFVDAIRYAWSKGVVCVVAAGNDFVLSSDFTDEPAIVVGATDHTDSSPSYSNGVADAQWGMAAPGGAGPESLTAANDVYSTYWVSNSQPARYAYLTGTSMAAPHVAGAAAVLRSLGLTPQQTVDRLLTTAKDLGSPGKDSTYGYGRLDLAKAVAGLGPQSTGGGGTTTTAGGKQNQGGGGTGAAGGGTGTATTTDGGGTPRGAGGNGVASGQGASATTDGSGSTTGAADSRGGDLDAGFVGAPEGDEQAAPERPGDDRAIPPWPVVLVALALLGGAGASLSWARRV